MTESRRRPLGFGTQGTTWGATAMGAAALRLTAAPTTATARRRITRGKTMRLAAAAALALSALFFAADDDSSSSWSPSESLRNLRSSVAARVLEKTDCLVKTPYLLVRDVVGHMPPLVPPPLRAQPSHVTLCQEYLARREKYGDAVADMDEEPLTVMEDRAVCSDWSAPHFSVLQVFASSLVAKVGAKYGLRYTHGCHRDLPRLNSKQVSFDYTSVQQLLDETLTSDSDGVGVGDAEMVKLCRGCVSEYETSGVPEFTYSASSHQCLLFPGTQPMDLQRSQGDPDGEAATQEDSQVALATILDSLTERLRIVAADHLPLTDPLDDEGESGACIFVDDTATGMSPTVYERYVPSYVKSIQIFASASCAYAAVHNGNKCVAHGGAVRRYFVRKYQNTDVQIRYDVVASTAASWARMMHCHKLVCPPGSCGCLIPALAKVPGTTATVASASLSPNTERWYEHLAGAHIKNEGFEVVDLAEEEQVMVDKDGIEFVSGARDGELTIEDGNSTEEVIKKEFVQGAEGTEQPQEDQEGESQAQAQGQGQDPDEDEKDEGKKPQSDIYYNPDGSITLAAQRSADPSGNAPPPREKDEEGIREVPPPEIPPIQKQEEVQGQGQGQEGQEGKPQQEEPEKPGLVQQAPPEDLPEEEPQDQEPEEGGGPQLVQVAPPSQRGGGGGGGGGDRLLSRVLGRWWSGGGGGGEAPGVRPAAPAAPGGGDRQ